MATNTLYGLFASSLTGEFSLVWHDHFLALDLVCIACGGKLVEVACSDRVAREKRPMLLAGVALDAYSNSRGTCRCSE